MSNTYKVEASIYALKTREECERDYKSIVKQIHKLEKKFKKFNEKNDPDRVKRNVVKSRGKEALEKIKQIEDRLKVLQEDRFPADRFFKE